MHSKPLSRPILFFFFFLFTSNLHAQHDFLPGYVVKNTGDTIYGLIDDKSSTASLHSCLFKYNADKDAVVFSADEITAYRFTNGRYFLSYRSIDPNFKQKIFFEYLLKGKLQIYRALASEKGNKFYVKKDSLLVSLDNSENAYTDKDGVNYLTRSQRYKGQLNYLMNDQPELQKQIKQFNTMTTGNLVKLSKKYHKLSCPNDECIEYAKSEKSLKINWGVGVAYGFPSLFLNDYIVPISSYYLKKYDFKQSQHFNIRLPVDIQFINISRKISVLVSPGISKSIYKSDILWETATDVFYQNKVNLEITSFDIPVCFKYSFNSSAWKVWPYLGLGIQYSVFLNKKDDFYLMRNYRGAISTDSNSDFDFSNFQNSLFGTVGLDIPIKTHKIGLYVNYEMGDGIHRLKYLDSFLKMSNTKMVSVGASWFF